jgi:betaine/carnitine transporter, BCCT family
MLFAAGMGIGLMFFGVLEPAYYFATPWGDAPLGTVRPFAEDGTLIEANVEEARRMALAATSYHWALHPWAIYAVVALALALFTYNKGLPLTIRSAFYPILGERVWGWWGHLIDTSRSSPRSSASRPRSASARSRRTRASNTSTACPSARPCRSS